MTFGAFYELEMYVSFAHRLGGPPASLIRAALFVRINCSQRTAACVRRQSSVIPRRYQTSGCTSW